MIVCLTENREEMRWLGSVMSGHLCDADDREQRLPLVHCGQVTLALASCSPSQRPLEGRQREFDPRQRQAATAAKRLSAPTAITSSLVEQHGNDGQSEPAYAPIKYS